MKWILLLAITKIHELSEPVTTDQDTWVEDLQELAEDQGDLRQQTGMMIADLFEHAPWGLRKQQGASSFDTVRTVNAVHAGIVQFSRQLEAEIKELENQGVVLKQYDVEEAREEEGDEVTISVATTKLQSKHRPKSKVGSSSSTKSKVRAVKKTVGHGNHAHGRAVPWTAAESVGLLRLYQDNPDRKIVSHPQIAILHNANFWPEIGEGRSHAAVSQQYLKLVQHDVARIPAKLVELRQLLAAQQ